MKKNINIIIDNKIPFIKGILEPYANVRYLPPSEITKDQVKDTDILIIRTRTRCNENLLSGSRCKFIGTATIGFDHIDTEYCKQNDIEWKNAPGCNASSVGQYILASLLLHAEQNNYSLKGKKIGIVGVGHVGSIVAHHCRTIGMTVLLNDPPRANTEQNDTFVSLDTIAEECDFITFHTPLNRTGIYRSFHLADNSFFKKLRKQPVIINSSRGEVVDNKALLTAYQEKKISDIIIDCWENEPDILPELLESAFIATPHIAGYSADGKSNASRAMVREISRILGIEIDISKITSPPAPFPEIDLNVCSGDPITNAVIASYDPRTDTTNLRYAPEQFENLRGNYGLRREFGAYKIMLSASEKIPVLKELGFISPSKS